MVHWQKGVYMDILILGLLAVCFLLVKLLIDWCSSQIDKS